MTTWDITEAPIRPSAHKQASTTRTSVTRSATGSASLTKTTTVLYLGPDMAARLIEVGVRSDENGVRIVHAMRPARHHRFE